MYLTSALGVYCIYIYIKNTHLEPNLKPRQHLVVITKILQI